MPVTSGCSYLREWRVVNSSVRSPLDPRRLWCRGVLASQTGRAFSFAEARLAVIDRAVPLSVARKLDWRPLSWRIVAHRGTSWHIVAHRGTSWHIVAHRVTSWNIVAHRGTSWHIVAHGQGSQQSFGEDPRRPDHKSGRWGVRCAVHIRGVCCQWYFVEVAPDS